MARATGPQRMPNEKVFRIARQGIALEVIEYGARLRSCLVPDASGELADVVPGFDSASDYGERGGTMGAVLGRYGNRIGFGQVSIGGRVYQLSRNDGNHTMHGGVGHFGTLRWQGVEVGPYSVALELTSEDGDQGWPGQMQARVVYTLAENAELQIDMQAICDHDTFINMLFHGYWNLAGHAAGSVADHVLKVAANHYTPKGEDGLPTGQLESVEGTAFDFRKPKRVGADIGITGRGYAHNLCLNDYTDEHCRPVAWLLDPKSGRALTLETDQPGLQLFTANSWAGIPGKNGAIYQAHDGLALESQLYPNTPNTPSFTPRIVRAGETYRHKMVVRFEGLEPARQAAFFAN
jgi:aldose 1-epimerase